MAVLAGIAGHVDARRDLDEARRLVAERRVELVAAAGETAAAGDDVADASARLAAVSTELRVAQEQLAARTRERNDAEADLAIARARLEQARGDLEAAAVTGDLQARQVEALRVCLRGVTRVLNALAVGDVRVAGDELVAVGPACAEAESIVAEAP